VQTWVADWTEGPPLVGPNRMRPTHQRQFRTLAKGHRRIGEPRGSCDAQEAEAMLAVGLTGGGPPMCAWYILGNVWEHPTQNRVGLFGRERAPARTRAGLQAGILSEQRGGPMVTQS
jgi:hypothetical protein